MLQAIQRIEERTVGRSFEEFAQDQDSVEIVAWNFLVLGEASTHVPAEVMAAHPEIPWADMRAMRNRVVHGYHLLDCQIVWDTATVEIPPLVAVLEGVASESETR